MSGSAGREWPERARGLLADGTEPLGPVEVEGVLASVLDLARRVADLEVVSVLGWRVAGVGVVTENRVELRNADGERRVLVVTVPPDSSSVTVTSSVGRDEARVDLTGGSSVEDLSGALREEAGPAPFDAAVLLSGEEFAESVALEAALSREALASLRTAFARSVRDSRSGERARSSALARRAYLVAVREVVLDSVPAEWAARRVAASTGPGAAS